MSHTVTLPREELEELEHKAKLLDKLIARAEHVPQRSIHGNSVDAYITLNVSALEGILRFKFDTVVVSAITSDGKKFKVFSN